MTVGANPFELRMAEERCVGPTAFGEWHAETAETFAAAVLLVEPECVTDDEEEEVCTEDSKAVPEVKADDGFGEKSVDPEDQAEMKGGK